jgi:magnesium chelatase subunit D
MVGFSDGDRAPVPFPAIVGQERLKRALLAVATNDALDGLLIRGEKGTAKSTAVRALVDLLPQQRAVADCPYGCPPDDTGAQCEACRERDDPPVERRPVPLVTLPLGATRERVVGTLSVADALDGDATFDPGLLARANRGVLYVDEVNLLDDHLVDVLLDAAASGENRVERDGVSVTHPADFTLVGTMNPEEGDLRPQLRDRFALQVSVAGSDDVAERVRIVEDALDRDAEPDAFARDYVDETGALRERVVDASERWHDVTLPDEFVERIARTCRDAGADGHRGDIAAARTAVSLAALDGRNRVVESDVREALEFALPHRLRSRPFEEDPDLDDVLDQHFGDESPSEDSTEAEPDDGGDGGEDESAESGGDGGEDGSRPEPKDGTADRDGPQSETASGEPHESPDDSSPGRDDTEERPASAEMDGSEGASDPNDRESRRDDSRKRDGTGDDDESRGPDPDDESEDAEAAPLLPGERRPAVGASDAPDVDVDEETVAAGPSAGDRGRASAEASPDNRGPRVRTEPAKSGESVDAAASVRAAAKRGETSVEPSDLRQSVRAGEATALVVFGVDASASMRPAMRAAKGTVMELLRDAYRERDEVAFVAFAGDEAEVLLPPTDSVSLAARHLKDLPTGDRTPLPAGIETARRVIERADPAASVAVLVTDGRANVADGSPTEATRDAARGLAQTADRVVTVDASDPDDRAGLIDDIAEATEGSVVSLSELSVDRVTESVRDARDTSE